LNSKYSEILTTCTSTTGRSITSARREGASIWPSWTMPLWRLIISLFILNRFPSCWSSGMTLMTMKSRGRTTSRGSDGRSSKNIHRRIQVLYRETSMCTRPSTRSKLEKQRSGKGERQLLVAPLSQETVATSVVRDPTCQSKSLFHLMYKPILHLVRKISPRPAIRHGSKIIKSIAISSRQWAAEVEEPREGIMQIRRPSIPLAININKRIQNIIKGVRCMIT